MTEQPQQEPEPEYMVQYVRTKARQPVGVVAGIRAADGHHLFGWSLCSGKPSQKLVAGYGGAFVPDVFNKQVGRDMALGRAKRAGTPEDGHVDRHYVGTERDYVLVYPDAVPQSLAKVLDDLIWRAWGRWNRDPQPAPENDVALDPRLLRTEQG